MMHRRALLSFLRLGTRLMPLALALAADVAASCDEAGRALPPRPAAAVSGHAFAAAIANLDGAGREAWATREVLAGNMPAFLRSLRAVVVQGVRPGGEAVQVVLCVMPDYLSVGDDDDFVRLPMGLTGALAVASRLGFTLPTRRIVDRIYEAAALRLSPLPLPASDRMRSVEYLQRHEALIRQQQRLAADKGALTAGHKKDLVLTPRLWREPERVAIYGWHRASGVPIQPLSTVHGARYADYSHGIRLVHERVLVDGVPRSIFDVLADPILAPLLSDEGPMPGAAAWITTAVAAPR
jgi:hypothetical protein